MRIGADFGRFLEGNSFFSYPDGKVFFWKTVKTVKNGEKRLLNGWKTVGKRWKKRRESGKNVGRFFATFPAQRFYTRLRV